MSHLRKENYGWEFSKINETPNNLPIEEEEELKWVSYQKPCKKKMEFFNLNIKKQKHFYIQQNYRSKVEGKFFFRQTKQTKSEVIHHSHICPSRNTNKSGGQKEKNKGQILGLQKERKSMAERINESKIKISFVLLLTYLKDN